MVAAADYPYISYTFEVGTCHVDTNKAVVDPYGYSYWDSYFSESDIASYVQSTGPVAVLVDACTWNTYTGGVTTYCPFNGFYNSAQAVGVDASPNGY